MLEKIEKKITSYGGAKDALINAGLKQSLYDAGGVIMKDTLLTLHGDEHQQRRTIEFRVFGRGFFRYYEQEVFPLTLYGTLKPYIQAGGGDLVEIGYGVTLNLTADFAGIDRPRQSQEEVEQLKRLVMTFSEGATLVHSTRDHDVVRREVREALKEFDETFLKPSKAKRELLVERFNRGELGQDELPKDLMTVLLLHQDRLHLSAEVFLREIAFIMQAGSHSTSNSTIHAFHEIITWCNNRPEEWERITQDPIFMQRCVHESLRLHPASPVAWRHPVCPVHLKDVGDVGDDDKVVIDLFSANRDRSIFGDDADKYNPHRILPKNIWPFGLTFGYGVHACLGRDLDGGVVPKPNIDPDNHQYGIVTLFLRALLDQDAQPDPNDPASPDTLTERPNWGRYPIIFSKISRS